MTLKNKVEEKITPKKKVIKIIILFLTILVVLSAAGLALIPVMIMPMFLGQRFEQEQYHATDYGIEAERITLVTKDQLSLAAWRTQAKQPKGTVILLSGIQNPSVTAFFGYAKWLSENGWDTLLIEMRARSQSEGEEIGFGMTEWQDVQAGVYFLMNDDRAENLPMVAMGTSQGASTVLIAAGELPDIDGVISLSAFSSFSSIFSEYMTMGGMPEWISIMDIPFMKLFVLLHYGSDALSYSAVNGISKLDDRPLLMMHSTNDSQVPYSEFEKLLQAAEEHAVDLSTFIREGDEHFICYDEYFNDPSQDQEFSQAILTFLEGIVP